MKKEPLIISACLVGIKSRYNGSSALRKKLVESLKDYCLIPVCPEQLGGLPTPRATAEIINGDGMDVLKKRAAVVDKNGFDLSKNFIKGAKEVLSIALLTGAKRAFLKEDSPSCGVNTIIKKDSKIKGKGVTSALLKTRGIEIRGMR